MNIPRIRIVLVETSHPGNIGAAARAMKNMGLEELVLVAPEAFPHPQASARASGADDILAAARVVATLPEALVGCALAIGSSARPRHLAAESLEPRGCAALLTGAVARGETCALVFGRERTGLTNAELDHCTQLVHIPTNPAYSSLNVAAAVQVLAYEVRMSWLQRAASDVPAQPAGSDPFTAPATVDEFEQLIEHLQQVAIETGFLDPLKPKHLMRRLRRLFARTRLEAREVAILRGLLSATQGRKRAGRRDSDGD
ncbi:RNA methyltransferase [Plasticicumulans acidivorans]|uniref:tRNA (cytidine/uridine-2'-O-)-methyltransferase TrmJ n=1 Tax=Plasticicumulans acidivorans TaxID=886464 RepID=A0A317MQS7_9GAMM|nr:RNA methyltransferase [Plasticicumulans acidivorans]PWV59046.1 tRNA (cytidine32/uridine32-2'-O)-methyltransferase [Plasticicumulans acidivorans]